VIAGKWLSVADRAQHSDRGAPRRERAAVGWIWRVWAALVVAARYVILLAWIAAAVAATFYLAPLTPASGIGGLIPSGAPALQAEYDSARIFGLPLTAQVAVVQRNPHGFSLQEQQQAARQADAVDNGHGTGIPGLAAAVPVANTAGAFPGSRERSTTIITFLYFRPGTPIGTQAAGGQAFARRYVSAPASHLVGVTGPAPAQDAQSSLILRYLPWVELATLAAIALIVGLYFRSPGAPLATLACVAVAYLVAVRVVALVARRTGAALPPDIEPVLVVLLLGVTTDYSVFFLAGMRARLAEGLPRLQAARRTTAEFTPIIVTAGLVVAGGVAALTIAQIGSLAAFGPALALTVAVAMAVAVTLAPALIATFGSLLFRPGPAWFRRAAAQHDAAPLGDTSAGARPGRVTTWQDRLARLATARPVALAVAAACVAALVLAGLGLGHIRLGFPLIRALPANTQEVRAEQAAAKGFVPGILSPTEVLVQGPGLAGRPAALARLQRALAQQPGVAGVLGPASHPMAQRSLLQRGVHLTVARSGNAARYGVIDRTDPLGPAAINRVRELRRDLPALTRAAGLPGVRVAVGGETALVGEAVDAAVSDLSRVALIIAVVILVLLALLLRALVAPFYLLAASVLALLAALGLTVWIFQGLLHYSGLVYYVPFVVAVLLISLGSDYNVFVVGRIWEEARRRPLRDAVAIAAPRASRAITIAGLALAAGFGLLALVPLAQFRQIALAMVLGILLDTFVVRSLLVPALVVLFGRVGSWPGRTGRPVRRPAGSPAAEDLQGTVAHLD
jgi:putative drug exporter of the RND superfamily